MLRINKNDFNLSEFSQERFKQKMLCIKKGKDKEAFIFANESIKFVRKYFDKAKDNKRIQLIDIYYQAQLILNELGSKQGCNKCMIKNFNAAFSTFSTLHNCKSEDIDFRKKCGEYLKLTFEEMKTFYNSNSKLYETSLLKEKFKKNYKPLLIV